MTARKPPAATRPSRKPALAKIGRPESAPGSTSDLAPSTPLSAGTQAPDFKLPSTPDQSVALSDFRGQPVILAFYPADWSPVCGDQLALYNEVLSEFQRHGAELVGISVDGPWSHVAFAEHRHLHFPLLADFEPKGAVARRYGVYSGGHGHSGRALFVIDGKGMIHWSHLSPIGVNPGADGILAALESLSSAASDLEHRPGTTAIDADSARPATVATPRAPRSSRPATTPRERLS